MKRPLIWLLFFALPVAACAGVMNPLEGRTDE